MSNCIDILYLPHHEPSEKHRRMSIVNRSAQFSSFKALEGFDDAINLNNVTYDKKITLEDDIKQLLDCKLNKIKAGDKIVIKYYNNNIYCEKVEFVSKIDRMYKKIILSSDIIDIDTIINIELI